MLLNPDHHIRGGGIVIFERPVYLNLLFNYSLKKSPVKDISHQNNCIGHSQYGKHPSYEVHTVIISVLLWANRGLERGWIMCPRSHVSPAVGRYPNLGSLAPRSQPLHPHSSQGSRGTWVMAQGFWAVLSSQDRGDPGQCNFKGCSNEISVEWQMNSGKDTEPRRKRILFFL